MKLSQNLQDERNFIRDALTGKIICARCKCTLQSYADDCTADLSEMCPGFEAIESARSEFKNVGESEQ